ncbi:hypothetical protein BurJ1DRAFT_4410 [Burkholderiales bacterium JOSHI_001]|nr:hypothetical protein BurJ1DRAFT_4410 [Burkholderiales bacterium JOSHI_001]
MDPFTLHLALGCVLSFSHVDREATGAFGQAPDGVFYRQVSLIDAQGRKKVLEPVREKRAYSPGALFKVGKSPDGHYASYLVLRQGAGRNEEDVKFVSAQHCAMVRFVRPRDGAAVDASGHRGWAKDAPHSVRMWRDGQPDEAALPLNEAVRLNPSIGDK